MTEYDLDGWVYITDGSDEIWFGAEKWKKDLRFPEIEGEHLPGDAHYGYDLGTRERVITFTNVLLTSKSDKERLEYDVQDWNTAGTYTLKIKVDDNPSYEKLKSAGTTTELDVLCTDMKGVEKIAPAGIHKYRIKKLEFTQYG